MSKKERLKNLKTLINSSENQQLAFLSTSPCDLKQPKAAATTEKEFLKSVASFMNSGGGNLLIGVDKGGAIIGLENGGQRFKKSDRKRFSDYIGQLISDKLGPQFCSLTSYHFYKLDKKHICQIEISKSDIPVYVPINSSYHMYIRVGDIIRNLNLHEMLEYIESRY
ncbi:AlbA family DNA-binding domain-containing protein [Arenibacter lacus]|uniref:AlbA family DNA-binding domain-containing protein n=1 Tax=Arenibacter lacus TaxID=2608629 RepID=UPI00168B3498|nr:ATP-binding protein [Arenibacter lacus]